MFSHPTGRCFRIRGAFWAVPLLRVVVSWALYWGLLMLGNYQVLSLLRLSFCVQCLCVEGIDFSVFMFMC